MSRELQSNTRIILGGREYTIQKTIGHGASCFVYHAVCEDLTEHILKEFNPRNIAIYRETDGELCLESEDDRDEFQAGLARFREGHIKQRELRLDSDLKNSTSNVQGIYQANGTEYIDMSCFTGDSYEKVTEKSVYDLLKRMKAVAQVIGNYHKAGLLHLDIKPENIFTLPETCEMVMLFDFDSVVSKEDAATGGARSYTLSWAAPEQTNPLKRKNICEATDIFAVGEMIFYQLVGKNRHSTTEERLSFAEYHFDHKLPIFENLNPKVFPMLEELLHHTICVSIKERYQSTDDLIAKLDEIIALTTPSKQQLVSIYPQIKQVFIGREKELNEIDVSLKNNKVLFLSGLGGIGKSELAKQYAIRHIKDYDTIIFSTFTGSIMMLINDDSSVCISNYSCPEGIGPAEYFKIKLEKMITLCTERTLFIVDNLNTLDFEGDDKLRWQDLLKLPCKFLFTTRLRITTYPVLGVKDLACKEDKIKLFEAWCEIEDDRQLEAASRIIDIVGGHTFCIELVAKQTYTGFLLPTEKLKMLIDNGINRGGKEIVEADKDLIMNQGRVVDHLCVLFDIINLDDAKQLVLNNMALLPPNGIDAHVFSYLCAWGSTEDTEERSIEVELDDGKILTPEQVKAEMAWLSENGWINRNKNVVSMHPVVSEVVLARKGIGDECCPYLQGVVDCFCKWETYPFTLKKQIIDCANFLYTTLKISEDASIYITIAVKSIGQFYCKKLYMMDAALAAFRLAEQKYVESNLDEKDLLISIKSGIASLYDYLADIAEDTRYRELAITTYQECVEAYRFEGADPLEKALLLQNLACAYDNNGVMDSAKLAFEEAILIMDSIVQNQGQTERILSEFATIYSNYATHYKRMRFYEAAFTNLNIAIEYALLLGDRTEKLAKIYHDMAITILLWEEGELGQALNFAKKSLEIRNEIFLPDSYYIAMSKYALARCYIKTQIADEIRKAKKLLDEAKPVYISVLGETHADVMEMSAILDKICLA